VDISLAEHSEELAAPPLPTLQVSPCEPVEHHSAPGPVELGSGSGSLPKAPGIGASQAKVAVAGSIATVRTPFVAGR